MVQSLPDNISYKAGNAGGNMWKNIIWAPIVLIILFLFVPDEMKLLIQGMAFLGFLIGVFWTLGWYEEYKSKRADRINKETQGRFIITPHGLWNISHKKIEVVRLTDTPYISSNGHHRSLTDDEYKFMLSKASNQKIIESTSTPIMEEVQESLFDLIDKHPHLLLIGGTGNGKTVLLRILADYKRQQGFRVIVLDSRSHPSHWDGFERYETEEQINRMIIRLHQVLRANIEALRQGHATEADFENSKVVVITDEWGRIVEECEGAPKFIEIMAKESRKYGIYLIFSTQTNQASELGLDNRYKTMNCFLQLEIQNRQDGRYVKVKKGTSHLGEYEVPFVNVPKQLPTGYIPPALEIDNTPKFTEQEMKVKEIYLQTGSLRAVVRQVLGIDDSKINTTHTNKIKETLLKLGVYTPAH